jgi:hypothetical protein
MGSAEEGQTMPDAPRCDGCDRKLTNANPPDWSERQRRFLDAYRQRPNIAPAARRAGVHRATVYRWLTDVAFAAALRAAAEVFFREHRTKVLAEEAARQRWREERVRARRPMRCYYLALARGESPAGDWFPAGTASKAFTCPLDRLAR